MDASFSSITEVVDRIFRGVACQEDVNARVGDFVATLAAGGIRAIPGVILYTGDGNVLVAGWTFQFEAGSQIKVGSAGSII